MRYPDASSRFIPWLLSLTAGVLFALQSEPAYAARPLVTNDSEPLEQGKFQLELGGAYLQDSARHDGQIPTVWTYGIVPNWEVSVGWGGQFTDQGGGEAPVEGGWLDTTLAAKHKFLEQKTAWVDQAFSVGASLPTASYRRGLGTGRPGFDLTWIVSRQVTEQLTVYGNIGYGWQLDRSDEKFSDQIHYSLASTYQLTSVLQPVAELLFVNPTEHGEASSGANVGLRYQILPNLTLDTAVGTHLFGDWPDLLATTGFTLVW